MSTPCKSCSPSECGKEDPELIAIFADVTIRGGACSPSCVSVENERQVNHSNCQDVLYQVKPDPSNINGDGSFKDLDKLKNEIGIEELCDWTDMCLCYTEHYKHYSCEPEIIIHKARVACKKYKLPEK